LITGVHVTFGFCTICGADDATVTYVKAIFHQPSADLPGIAIFISRIETAGS